MKRNNLFILLLATVISFSSCSNNIIVKPENIGKSVIEILKTISVKEKQDYLNNFSSIEEIRELGKNEEIVKKEKTRNRLTLMLKEDWINKVSEGYFQVKTKGEEFGINWKEIEFFDFVYEIIEDNKGFQLAEGKLFFKHTDNTYEVKTASIWNGEKYLLIKVDELKEH